MKDSQQLIRHVDTRVTPMADNLMETSTRLRATITRVQQVVDGDVVRVLQDTNKTLQEFSGTARSLRLLADYLERNPDSLLYGKVGVGGSHGSCLVATRCGGAGGLAPGVGGLREYAVALLHPEHPARIGDDPATAAARGPVIGVGPITLPKYLDRPQIVSRASRNQLALGEFDRWAEPLQENVSPRAGRESGAASSPRIRSCCIPGRGPPRLDYQVTGGRAAFRWLVRRGEHVAGTLEHPGSGRARARESAGAPAGATGGRDYDAMVVAMNQLLETLSRDIATAIQRLASRVVARE